MEKATLQDTLNTVSQAFAELENAKSDCNDVVNSAIDAHLGEIEGVTSKEHFKALKKERKDAAKAIKKVAKAMMRGDKAGVQSEADCLNEVLGAIA